MNYDFLLWIALILFATKGHQDITYNRRIHYRMKRKEPKRLGLSVKSRIHLREL